MKKKNFKTMQYSVTDVIRLLLIIILVGLIVISTKVLLAQSNYNNNIAYLNSYFLTEYQDFDALVCTPLETYKVKIKNKEYELAVANNSLASRRGLTGIDEMAPNEGMIYAFPEVGQYEFTTRGMKFDLDIIWLDENGKVVHIEKNLEPSDDLGYKPAVRSKYVLELKAGTVDSAGIRLGDSISLPDNLN